MIPLSLLLAFLLGSVPTSYLVVMLKTGRDIRDMGSGNPGATNVFRSVGKVEGLFVLGVDLLKGFLAVVLVGSLVHEHPLSPKTYPLILGLVCILGHTFSPFLRFRGGKGVATAAGVTLSLYPLSLAIAFGVWLFVLLGSGYMSVASITGALAFGVSVVFLISDGLQKTLGILAALFIVWTHRSNMRRLMRGEESKLIVSRKKI